MRINVRIDVSQNNPFSKYAQEQSLISILEKQKITFEEFVEALDDGSVTPKGKLQDILDKRKEQIENEKDIQIQQLTKALNQSTQIINGGGQSEMQQMPNGNVY